MKKTNILVVMVLGIVSTLMSSCSPMMVPYNTYDGYSAPHQVHRGTSDAVLYEDTPMYAYIGIIGDRRYPNQLIMRNLIISRRGMILTVTDGTGREIYGEWDLRYRDLRVKKIWHAKDLNGLPVEVTLNLRGSSGNNICTIKDGAETRTYQMVRH